MTLSLTGATVRRLGLAAALLFAPLSVQAAEIIPGSYTFDRPTACGWFCYYDGTTSTSVAGELTDGRTGVRGWAVDLGSGSSAEWVGWYQMPLVNIDFDFGSTVHVETIRIGTTQNRLDDVVLPSIDVYSWSGSDWTLVQSMTVGEDAANNFSEFSTQPRGFLALSGMSIDAAKIRIAAKFPNDGPFTFIDEVDFFDTNLADPSTAVPEPSTLLLVGGGLAGLRFLRRREARRP